jgi:hypothetical protein
MESAHLPAADDGGEDEYEPPLSGSPEAEVPTFALSIRSLSFAHRRNRKQGRLNNQTGVDDVAEDAAGVVEDETVSFL